MVEKLKMESQEDPTRPIELSVYNSHTHTLKTQFSDNSRKEKILKSKL